ncbi:MAG: hypothetical protein FJZ89_13370 [Chloroflexi bacterium]|nr:hypothetical protein [Chloroflexota bacterium]
MVGSFRPQLFFVKEKSFQATFRDLFHQVPSFLIIGNPLTDGLFHGLRDMDHLSLPTHPQSKIEAWVEFASGTFAARLTAGPLHGDEAAAEEGLFMEDLGETGSSPTFRIGQVASGTHEESPPFQN